MILRIWPTGSFLAAWILFTSISGGQAQSTITTSDAFGDTVVIVESTNLNGLPVGTTVLSTLSGTSATSTTTTDDGGGPIGYTTSTNEAVGPTTYVYTTTDQFGSKTLVTAVFTPTYEPTSSWPSVSAGTVINYSEYTSLNPRTSSGANKRATELLQISSLAVIAGVSTVLCVAAGGLFVIL